MGGEEQQSFGQRWKPLRLRDLVYKVWFMKRLALLFKDKKLVWFSLRVESSIQIRSQSSFINSHSTRTGYTYNLLRNDVCCKESESNVLRTESNDRKHNLLSIGKHMIIRNILLPLVALIILCAIAINKSLFFFIILQIQYLQGQKSTMWDPRYTLR